jgi:hypothetical protein
MATGKANHVPRSMREIQERFARTAVAFWLLAQSGTGSPDVEVANSAVSSGRDTSRTAAK